MVILLLFLFSGKLVAIVWSARFSFFRKHVCYRRQAVRAADGPKTPGGPLAPENARMRHAAAGHCPDAEGLYPLRREQRGAWRHRPSPNDDETHAVRGLQSAGRQLPQVLAQLIDVIDRLFFGAIP